MANTGSKERTLNETFQEKGFSLPLPTLVEGKDIDGNPFTEKTVLSYISQSGSSFWLTHSVAIGVDLRLTVDLPSKLAGEKELKLIIKGRIIFLEAPKNHNSRQRVSLKFEKNYIIEENS